jgi:hypothetical protein
VERAPPPATVDVDVDFDFDLTLAGHSEPCYLETLEDAEESVQAAWDEEVARRVQDLQEGKAVTVPLEGLHQELLAMLLGNRDLINT